MLSYSDFLKSFELSPRLAVELLMESPEVELLLLQRDREPRLGQWHLPGGFLLVNEPISDCIRRLARTELGIADLNPDLGERLGLFETIGGDPRGHVLHHPVRFRMEELIGRNYFGKLPLNTIDFQLDFLRKLGYQSEL